MFRVVRTSLCLIAGVVTLPAYTQQAPVPPPPGAILSAGTEIRVQIRARQHAILSAEMAGKIVELPFRDGETFRKGDRLVTFDCAAQRARQDQAAAAAQAASRKREVSAKLNQLNSISQLELAVAESAEAQAKAELALTGVMVQRCSITAPYDGRVSEVQVQRYAFAAEGAPLIGIYDSSQYDIEMIVPSAWLAWLKPGLSFPLRVDETGSDHQAEITRLSGAVDPVSQSVRVYGRIKGSIEQLRPGMSGSASLAVGKAP
ncbi:efflux RND transporter periplasmic adaptor subunit [Niveispirillum cyanobacteriorum]|uniref:efflux RND transporter periplasmic adaptor subunit n=1 Tax=Niveispirillum cyanobacteriorum TaxID=1612173 RepID=UPI0016656EBB|nr:efflux RND transporter periplasmic adaptor subunit [Niveispirillum cyanobacteriorum]